MLDNLPWWMIPFMLLVILVWGLALGSFTTCVVYRIPRRLSLWRQKNGSYRSFCPNCNATLHNKDLIPVFSYLFQKGRCRYCGAKIPSRYLWIELGVLCLVGILFTIFGISHWFFGLSLLIPVIAGILSFLLVSPEL